jgi:hypothetical protein
VLAPEAEEAHEELQLLLARRRSVRKRLCDELHVRRHVGAGEHHAQGRRGAARAWVRRRLMGAPCAGCAGAGRE